MANTFFGFDTSLNNESNLLPDDDGDLGEGEEDEYDALNDETFGSLGDSTVLNDDWEEQHRKYAHYDENSKQTERIENSIRDLMLNDSDDDERTFATPTSKGADWYYGPHEQHVQMQRAIFQQQQWKNGSVPPPKMERIDMELPNIPTVEEIEKMLSNSKLPFHQQQPPHPLQHPSFPQQQNAMQKRQIQQPPPRFPPGFPPQMAGLPPPRSLPPGLQPPPQPPPPNQRMPPGFPGIPGMPGVRPPGQFPPMPMLRPGMPLPPHLQQFASAGGGGGFANFPMPPNVRNGPPLPPHLQQQHMRQQANMMQMQMAAAHQRQKQEQQQQLQMNQNNRSNKPRDEYDGLMTNREKQWLLNIQHLQLNTGTPYFDDYYFTVFKERRARNDKENQPHHMLQHHQHHHQHHHHHNNQQQRNRNNSERSENQMQARTYTPQQFENSLGKLQCVSVTAPRKIIDTDVVTLEKDSDSTPSRDTRKTKQLLLDLESLYSLVLKAEDLLNPIAVANMEKLVEIKQKQRLREMEAAATPEAKQELLRLLQAESTPPKENPVDYLLRIMSNFLQEDKFASFMNIRKGKMLLLRMLPLLGSDYTIDEYAALWCRVLLCIPLIGRRDMVGDNLLPRLHPYFKRFVQTTRMADLLTIVNKLEQQMRPTEGRSTPLSHLNKAPLQFVVANKFGVSALVTMLVRTEYLISAGNATDAQIDEWSTFLKNWADATSARSMMATPLEVIPRPVFIKHLNRFPLIAEEKKSLLERHYADIN